MNANNLNQQPPPPQQQQQQQPPPQQQQQQQQPPPQQQQQQQQPPPPPPGPNARYDEINRYFVAYYYSLSKAERSSLIYRLQAFLYNSMPPPRISSESTG